jgi:hypothetical protein
VFTTKDKNVSYNYGFGRICKEEQNTGIEELQRKDKNRSGFECHQKSCMNIIVDTSVWIDYFQGKGNSETLDFIIEEDRLLQTI